MCCVWSRTSSVVRQRCHTFVAYARCLCRCKALFGSVAADSSRPCITTLHISLISFLFSKLFFLFSSLIPLPLHLNIPLLTKVWRLLVHALHVRILKRQCSRMSRLPQLLPMYVLSQAEGGWVYRLKSCLLWSVWKLCFHLFQAYAVQGQHAIPQPDVSAADVVFFTRPHHSHP